MTHTADENKWKNLPLGDFVRVIRCVDHTRRFKICIKAHLFVYLFSSFTQSGLPMILSTPLIVSETLNDGRVSLIVRSPPPLGLLYGFPSICSIERIAQSISMLLRLRTKHQFITRGPTKRILSHIGLALANWYGSNFWGASEIPCTKSKVMIKAMNSRSQAPYRLTFFLSIPFAPSVRRGIYDASTIVRASLLSLLHFQLRRFIFGIIHVFLCWRVRCECTVPVHANTISPESARCSQQIGAMLHSAGSRLTFMALNAECCLPRDGKWRTSVHKRPRCRTFIERISRK